MLKSKQIKVFKSIVSLGKTTIGKIAQETGMHRQSVRIILETLVKKGFVKCEGSGKYYYTANDLETIEKEQISKLDEIKKIIPRLNADYQDTKNTQMMNVLSGKLGLRTVLMDEIIKGKEILAFHLSPSRFPEEYRLNDERRKKNNIPMRIISNQDDKYILAKVKKTKIKSKIDLFVYADKVTILYNDYDTKILTVKIPEITKFFRNVFEDRYHDRSGA